MPVSLNRIVLTMFVLVGALCASNINLDVRSQVDRSEIWIGDRFDYQIIVVAPDSVVIEVPGLIGNLGAFEVKDYQVLRNVKKKSAEHIWKLTLSTFVGGTFILPPQIIEAVQGSDTVRTQTEPVPIKVLARVDSLSDEDIVEIEDVMHDGAWPLWLKALLIVLGVALLAVAIYFAIKHWKKHLTTTVLPPYEEAVAALSQLRTTGLLKQGMQAEHFFALGQILKRYLQRRFEADVVDATSSEIAERLDAIQGLTGALREEMVAFVQETDLVKFARIPLADDQAERFDRFADRLLHETRPMPEDAQKADAKKSGKEA